MATLFLLLNKEGINMQHEDEVFEILDSVNIIQIVSFEWERIDAISARVADKAEKNLYKWNIAQGLSSFDNENKIFRSFKEKGASEVLEWFQSNEASNSIVILEDFYPLLDENPQNIRIFRNIARGPKDRTIILSQPFQKIPQELDKDVHIITLDLSNKVDLEVIFRQCIEDAKYGSQELDENLKDRLIESALGLTIMEARKVFMRAIKRTKGKLGEDEIKLIVSEKEHIIKNSGFLEYYHHKEGLSDVGGLDELKNWLTKRGRAFHKEAKEYGLEIPKGVLLLGIPGTGKSLSAKAIGSEWKFPIIKLDMGRIFGGIVGESESNIRKALQITEAIAPSILWIDEIEKGFSGLSSSGSTDGGTTSRVLGTFLSWMQDKSKPVFVVATANDISKLPPELLRKGRIDEIFFVDLPSFNARKAIISIHLKRLKRNPSDFNLDALSNACMGFSGAEIEECIKDALFAAFNDAKEVDDNYIIDSAEKTYPLSKTMSESIASMRKWAKARAVYASSEEFDGELKNDKDVPQLRQEITANPFM